MAVSKRYRRKKRIRFFVCLLAFLAAAVFHISIAVHLANDETDDGKLYAQMAVTLLEQDVYSVDTQPPYRPTLIRLPGYPIFLAGVYSIFGHGNNTAVRTAQGAIFAGTCILAALLAWNWVEGKRRKRRKAAWCAFWLIAMCPFTAIFSAMILTETLTMLFMSAMGLAATYGLKTLNRQASWLWWFAAGILAGIAVFLRPDSGLFALGSGLTLAASVFFKRPAGQSFTRNFAATIGKGILFSAAFSIPLVPWTIRNERIFGVFQPLAPAHAEAPGEFVPRGYLLWVRTWIDDPRYISPMLWGLYQQQININKIPAYAFDSEEEKRQIAVLLDLYNHSAPNQQMTETDDSKDKDDSSDNSDSEDKDNDGSSADQGSDNDNKDESDDSDQTDQQTEPQDLKISPEVDAAFGEIAQKRIARRPVHFYLILPAERAALMWFDTHSAYYPFDGELFPTKDLDTEEYQEFWLPFFGGLVWVYTLLAIAGAIILWRNRRKRSRLWLLMVLMLSIPRIAFFGTLENPEPRYLVELFVLAAILGGIALAKVRLTRNKKSVGLEVYYGD